MRAVDVGHDEDRRHPAVRGRVGVGGGRGLAAVQPVLRGARGAVQQHDHRELRARAGEPRRGHVDRPGAADEPRALARQGGGGHDALVGLVRVRASRAASSTSSDGRQPHHVAEGAEVVEVRVDPGAGAEQHERRGHQHDDRPAEPAEAPDAGAQHEHQPEHDDEGQDRPGAEERVRRDVDLGDAVDAHPAATAVSSPASLPLPSRRARRRAIAAKTNGGAESTTTAAASSST